MPQGPFRGRPRRSMQRNPLARFALGRGDLGRRHLAGELATIAGGALRSAESGDVEPLVGFDEVLLDLAADRVHHAEFVKDIAGGAGAAGHLIDRIQFKTSHDDIPCLRIVRGLLPRLSVFRRCDHAEPID
ncbi:hypothetical protein KL86PLE_130269 [uncultured Pleomorphomonas sp.]|uniref:Uncharacterized protein n=1 Tax=uncultured Pleomorphomonas sp. TaxID=442121 RepID=A0A212LAM2_9HYPH|nr:hypothetical protein KL86PLE_130269 [uncultured Pleomorphomonas sp.]